jgi:hypothetical protein
LAGNVEARRMSASIEGGGDIEEEFRVSRGEVKSYSLILHQYQTLEI